MEIKKPILQKCKVWRGVGGGYQSIFFLPPSPLLSFLPQEFLPNGLFKEATNPHLLFFFFQNSNF